ncbi:hypothetical protein L1887_62658 [Cichorium endivia]|nr:hypothetical protein L1887_62658 [Cichorium endivia]
MAAPCLGSLQPSIATALHERAQPNKQRGSMQAWANEAAAQASSASDSNQGVPSRRACKCMAPVRQEASKADEAGARESNLYRRVGGANPKKDSKSDCVVKGGESSLAAWFRHELARSTAQREPVSGAGDAAADEDTAAKELECLGNAPVRSKPCQNGSSQPDHTLSKNSNSSLLGLSPISPPPPWERSRQREEPEEERK